MGDGGRRQRCFPGCFLPPGETQRSLQAGLRSISALWYGQGCVDTLAGYRCALVGKKHEVMPITRQALECDIFQGIKAALCHAELLATSWGAVTQLYPTNASVLV